MRTIGDLLVGFKWIAQAIDEFGPDLFVYGTEESHGYMAGSYVRDKDGAVASLLLCELAAKLKAAGQTLHEKLDALFWQHGVHAERTVSRADAGQRGHGADEGSDGRVSRRPAGRDRRRRASRRFAITSGRRVTPAGGKPQPLAGPKGDLVFLDLATEGNYVACRPSGTEPKIKFYMFAYTPPEQLANLEVGQSGARRAARPHGSRSAEVRGRVTSRR